MKKKIAYIFFVMMIVSMLDGCLTFSQGWREQIAGNYEGKILVRADEYNTKTTFFFDKDGLLKGRYEMKEIEYDSVVEGELHECNSLGEYENRMIRCKWKDENGIGDLQVKFSEDFSSFFGRWNYADYTWRYRWTGIKSLAK